MSERCERTSEMFPASVRVQEQRIGPARKVTVQVDCERPDRVEVQLIDSDGSPIGEVWISTGADHLCVDVADTARRYPQKRAHTFAEYDDGQPSGHRAGTTSRVWQVDGAHEIVAVDMRQS